MECCEMNLSMFPLLRSDIVYRPDTVSLNHDPEAREYWICCMEGSIEKVNSCTFQIHRALCYRRLMFVYLDTCKVFAYRGSDYSR